MKTLPAQQFELMLQDLNLHPVKEYKFYKDAQWRFDYAFPEKKIAFEVDGGVWKQGRHQRPIGFMGDCKKYLWAQAHGWKVIRIPSPWLYCDRLHFKKQQKSYMICYEDLKEIIRKLLS